MEAADLLIKLKDTIASPFAADVFKAIFIDPLVLKAFNDPETMDLIMEVCGSDPYQWTPAGIGLAASNFDLSIEQLKTSPIEPLPPELRQQVTALYQKVLLKDYTISTLSEAVMVAMAMHERRRLTDSWNGLTKEITRNFAEGSFVVSQWQTTLAILVGISHDSDELWQELSYLNGKLPSKDFASLMLHILLTNNYLNYDLLNTETIQLIKSMPSSECSQALDWLEQHGYDQLAKQAAQQITIEPYNVKGLGSSESDQVVDPLEKQDAFERLAAVHNQSKLFEYQKNSPIQEALMQEEERLIHHAEAVVTANRLAMNPDQNNLEGWKRVALLAPESDLAKAELALALLRSDDPGQVSQLKFGSSYHPLVLAVKAYLTHQQGNLVETELYLDHLAGSLHASPSINRHTANRIVDMVGEIDLPEKVQDVLKSLPFGMPAQQSVMRSYANQLYKAKQFSDARQYAEAALLLNDADSSSRRLIARTYEGEDNYKDAMKLWEELIQNSDTSPETEDQRAYANCAVRCGQPNLAIDTCKSIIEKQPTDGFSYLLMGDAYQQVGEYDHARDSYEKAVAISPEIEESWTKLANYHLANNERDKAVDILSTAIKAVPHSANLHYLLGCQYAEEDSNAEAIQQFVQAYTLEPKNMDFIRALGNSYANAGRWEEAEDIYAKAARIFPFDAGILRSYGKSLLNQNRKEDALVPYKLLIELHPSDVEIYIEFSQLVVEDLTGGIGTIPTEESQIELLEYSRDALDGALDQSIENWVLQLYLAEILSKLNDREQSREYFTVLSEHIYELPQHYHWRVNYGLGLTSGEMGEYEVALAALQEAAGQNPSNFQIHHQLAEAFLRANLGQSAIQAAQQALSIDPKDPDNLIWYAEFCTRSDELPEALSTLDALLKIQPDNIDLRIKLGALQLKTGLIEQAKETFRKLLADSKLRTIHYQQIGQHLASVEEYSEAIGFLKLGIQSDPPSSLPLLLDLVQYEQKSGDISSALQSLEQAVSLDPLNLRLQIIKADMLAFDKDYEAAIQTLEQVLSDHPFIEDMGGDEVDSVPYYEMHLRLAYLYRKTGSILQAKEACKKCLVTHPNDTESSYLLADMAFNRLETDETLQILSSIQANGKPNNAFTDIASILQVMVYLEKYDRVSARKMVETLALGSRWHTWKSALDILTQDPSKVELKTVNAIRQELDGLSYQDIEQLLPPQDQKDHSLPDLGVYHPMTIGPTLFEIIILALVQTGGFEPALSILDEVRDQYPYELSPVFTYAKIHTIQAEQHRLFELGKITHNLPSADSLSLGTFETFEEMILATERIITEDIVEDWHRRGVAAFYPTIDNFVSLLERPAYVHHTQAIIWKLALENKIGELKDFLNEEEADVHLRCLAAILTTEKAASEAIEMIEPVIDFLAVHPLYLAIHAIVANNAGVYEPALDTIENAISTWPDESEWHILAARLCMQLNNEGGALYHLKAAAELKPEDFLYAMEMGDGCAKYGDFVQAIQYYRKAAHIDPVNASPWYGIAKAYQESGDLNQALASIERSVTLAPNQADPQILSAEFSLSAGRVEEALRKIDTALRIDPKNVNALSLKARALVSAGQTDEAMGFIQNSLKKAANPLPLLLTRAEITRVKEGPKAFLKSLHEIAQDYPSDTNVLRMYALSLAENGQPADALHITQMALKNDPELQDMHILAGRLLRSTGQLDQAIDHFSACVNLDQTNTEAYLEMAKTYQERRDFSKAIKVYEKAIEYAPMDYRGYYQLGLVLRDAKDYKGAEKMLRKASELSKEDVNILRQLGAIIALNLVHNSQEASVQS